MYAFTKALGERVVTDVGAEIAVSIVRPAIVESSWKHPYPGWIEGFKMAEPLILAYGRGELPEFPASPDSVLDIVPCDLVVNAILAVCATRPEPGRPEFYHVSSGARNRLTFNDMYGHIRSYFTAHPLANVSKPGAPLPEVEVPRRGVGGAPAVDLRADPWTGRAGRVPGPRSVRTRELARDLDRFQPGWTSCAATTRSTTSTPSPELHFVDDNTLALTSSLDPATSTPLPSTPRCTTGRPTSRMCTVPRSPPRFDGWRR